MHYYYTVGDISRLTGINPSTIRYYISKGELHYSAQTVGGISLFTLKDFEYLLSDNTSSTTENTR